MSYPADNRPTAKPSRGALRPKVKKFLAILGAIGFVVSAVITLVVLIIPPADEPADPTPTPTTTPTATGTDTPSEGGLPSEATRGSGIGTNDIPETVFDKYGMVAMTETSDPHLAAAAAASVMMSVDASKVGNVEDFRAEALRRVLHPSDDYVGVGDQIIFDQGALHGGKITGADLVENSYNTFASDTQNTNSWWMLNDTAAFQSFTGYHATITSQAIAVYNAEEMATYVGDPDWEKPLDAEINLTKDGASLGVYWVRLDTTVETDHDTTTQRRPAGFLIYCDPPTESGNCGVISTISRFPQAWKVNDY